ncbi:hypothetical protein F511_18504 [Dorcoceras hygrometricum]|uniref:Uncharacterized protein n=1 Tax=Dorcoceras hygrometricum TaxID=472368 RepID=A0A2Z7APU2_9LAMI|nr:hypothetical protein F511_18504 [Dorcoceras hygrometricum]
MIPFISTVDESINSRYSRRRRIASWSWSWNNEEDQLERFVDDISSDVIIQQKLQCSADEDSADEKRCARYGISCDDISLDVITISSWLSADGAKRKRRCDVTQESAGSLHPDARGSDVVEEIFSRSYSAISRCYLKIAIAKRCRLYKLIRQRFALALKIQQEDFALIFQQSKLQKIQSQRKDFQTQYLMIQTQEDKSIIVKEDSGEEFY